MRESSKARRLLWQSMKGAGGALAACLIVLLATPRAQAAEGGYSNYIPGTYGDFGMALAPTETWTFRNDVYYYDAEVERSVRSGEVDIGADLEFRMDFMTLLYKPEVQLLGAQYAAGLFVPIVDLEIETSFSTGPLGVNTRDSTSGLGDVALIPIALYWTGQKLHASFTELIVTPTGSYDQSNAINTGLNYWSFDTNFALTYLDPEKGRDASFNIGYIINTENDDTDYKTGQELHFDVVFNQFLSETLAIGIQGFYLEQITGDSGSGARLGGFEGEAAGIGPALLWATQIGGQTVSFIAKWLHEFHAENRIEGDHVIVSFALDW